MVNRAIGRKYRKSAMFKEVWATLDRAAKWQEEFEKNHVKWLEESEQNRIKWQKESEENLAKWREEREKNRVKWEAEHAEWETKHAKRIDEIDRLQKENARHIGGLGNEYGEMIEYMVKPNLAREFKKLGFTFDKMYNGLTVEDEQHNRVAQVDFILEDGDTMMLVEVKSKPTIADVKDHLKRMDTMRRLADLHNNKRVYLGAVAGMVLKDNVREFIFKSGFYAIEPSRGEPSPLSGSVEDTGETFAITPPGEPKTW